MPRPVSAIIVSPSGLIRELIADWLQMRFDTRIAARFATPDECRAPLPPADLLVWDASDSHSLSVEATSARLASLAAGLSVAVVRDRQATLAGALATIGIGSPAAVAHEPLTQLETEVLVAVASGYRNAEIARRMRRSSKTIEKHRANLQRKLGLRTVAQLTAYALNAGLLEIDTILGRR